MSRNFDLRSGHEIMTSYVRPCLDEIGGFCDISGQVSLLCGVCFYTADSIISVWLSFLLRSVGWCTCVLLCSAIHVLWYCPDTLSLPRRGQYHSLTILIRNKCLLSISHLSLNYCCQWVNKRRSLIKIDFEVFCSALTQLSIDLPITVDIEDTPQTSHGWPALGGHRLTWDMGYCRLPLVGCSTLFSRSFNPRPCAAF